MHSKSDGRLLWRVAADMFIVDMVTVALGGRVRGVRVGKSLHDIVEFFVKLPVYMEVRQMGTPGCGRPIPSMRQASQIRKHTHSHIIFKEGCFFFFFLKLSQSHTATASSATICPQSAQARNEMLKVADAAAP